MEAPTSLEEQAVALSKDLEKQLHDLTIEFNQKVKGASSQFGIHLITEVNFILETKDQEGL